jgi:hypothetical protein
MVVLNSVESRTVAFYIGTVIVYLFRRFCNAVA